MRVVQNDPLRPRSRCMAETPRLTDDAAWSGWYVLTTSNPKHLEDLIAQENAVRPGLLDSFCPYTSLPTEKGNTDNGHQQSLRAALRRYDFVRVSTSVSEAQFVSTVQEWSRLSVSSILFLRNSSGAPAKVSDRQLNMMRASCDAELIKPDSIDTHDLKVGQRLKLTGTPFDTEDGEERECVVQAIRRKKGGRVELRVETTLFNVKFSNLTVTYEDPGAASKSSDMVYDAQQKLLAIFRRKINNKETEASRRKDEQTLHDLFEDRNITLPEGAMHRHHLALMLVCTRMMNDKNAMEQYTGLVQAELGDLERVRESKAATDSRCWLHIAMFIATGKPHWRNQAKAYIKNYKPKSTYLQQFVKQSCKTAGERWIGLRKRRKTEG